MRKIWLISSIIMMIVGCAKDLPIPASALSNTSLQTEILQFSSDKVRYDAFAFCGNHPDFEKMTRQLPIHIFAAVPKGATDVKYHETDTFNFRDSLAAYTTKHLENGRLEENFFYRYYREGVKTDRFCRISYRIGDSLFVSPSITLRAATLVSSDINDLITFTGEDGFFTFDWPNVPGTNQYIWLLSDHQENVVLGVLTARSSFRFYDLRDASFNFFPNASNPSLVAGGEYTMDIYALTNRGWLLAKSNLTFTYDPVQ